MQLRKVAAVTVLTVGMSFPLAGVALAQDLDCGDFTWQEDAQAVLDRDPSDPHGLDGDDNDGKACEHLPSRATGSDEDAATNGDQDTGAAPNGGVETGAGGTAEDDSALLVPVSLAGGVVLAAGGVVLVRRRPVRQRD